MKEVKITPHVSFIIAWYDIWIGGFYDKAKRRLYLLPLPFMGFIFKFNDEFPTSKTDELYSTYHKPTKGICTINSPMPFDEIPSDYLHTQMKIISSETSRYGQEFQVKKCFGCGNKLEVVVTPSNIDIWY